MAQNMKPMGQDQGKQPSTTPGSDQDLLNQEQRGYSTSPDGTPMGVSHHPVSQPETGSTHNKISGQQSDVSHKGGDHKIGFGNTELPSKGVGTAHLGNIAEGGIDQGGRKQSNQPQRSNQGPSQRVEFDQNRGQNQNYQRGGFDESRGQSYQGGVQNQPIEPSKSGGGYSRR